jgi:hypothetical protein
MTSGSHSPVCATIKPSHRCWYWPLHGATCGAIIATVAVLFFANVPGQEVWHPNIHDDGKYGPHWEACTPYYEHGWPRTYLKRERFYQRLTGGRWQWFDRSPWDFETSSEAVDQLAVVFNGLCAVIVAAIVIVGFQLWFGRRGAVWQFRLIDLFALVAVLCLGLAWYVWNRQEHEREIKLVRSLKPISEQVRGLSIADEDMARSWWYEMRPGGPTFLRRIVGDQPFQIFDRVVQCEFLSDAPQFAREFHHLRVFSTHSITTDLGKHLSEMKDVEAIDFCFANLEAGNEDEASQLWDGFPSLPQLRCINLHHSGSDASTRWLARCPNLERITLTDGDISDIGAANIAKLKRLKILEISGKELTDEGCRLLSTLPELEELWLESQDAGDGAVNHLSQMRSMKKLTLYGLQITDEGLRQLSQLRQLEELGVEKTNVTADGIRRIKAQLPKCQIYHDT